MKNLRVFRPLSLSLFLCGLTVLGASTVRAADCPATSPDRTDERRALAKEWFARAEAAENAGNDVEAVRAYACSMKMVAHAFTAFNLGRVAERSGDLELALKSYKAYLTLKSDAPDKDEVQTKITDLQAKILEVKETVPGGEPAATEPPTAEEKPEAPAEPPKEKPEKPLPIEPPPAVAEQAAGGRGSSRILVWVVGGVGVAALTTAIITNVIARNDMSTCNSKANGGDLAQALSACNSAKPVAYTSYAMFGVAGAAAVVEGVLLYRVWSSGGGDSSDDTSVSLGWLPGGLSLSARGRF
jgi:hypothetical protein